MAIADDTKAVDARIIDQAAPSLKLRRKALLTALVTGRTVADASRFAGYSTPKHGSEALSDIRKKLPALMDALGLSTPELLRKLHKKTEAQKVITATWMGDISDVIEVDDNPTQMDAIKLSLRLHGYLANEDSGPTHLNIAINNVSVVDKTEE